MIFEIAEIDIKPGQEKVFIEGAGMAAPYFREAKGCRTMRLERSIEHPSSFRLVIGWDSVEDHTVTFRQSAGFERWRELVGGFFAAPPKVTHVETLLECF